MAVEADVAGPLEFEQVVERTADDWVAVAVEGLTGAEVQDCLGPDWRLCRDGARWLAERACRAARW